MDLVLLEDDKHFFPDYALVPTIRTDILKANPRLGELLDRLSGKLDDATMQRLNGEIDVQKKSIEAVATAFLTANGL